MNLACRCSIAGIAQFYPRKHPDNWWLLLCCIVGYAIGTAALNLFLLRFEGDVFFFTKAAKVHNSASSGQQQLHPFCHPAHVPSAIFQLCAARYLGYAATSELYLAASSKQQLLPGDSQDHASYYPFLQDLPALKFIAKMPRYSDEYTLLIRKCNNEDSPNSVLHLMPWMSVLRSCIPGLRSSKASQSRLGSLAHKHACS